MKFLKNLLTFIVFCNSFHFFSQKKPNVVMIVLDDLNDFTGYMNGHPQAETPNIDNLASQSVIFNNAHSNVPVCSPSRASFMTGIHPITSKFWGFGNALKNEVFMNSKSIPEFLKENGYQVFQTGKVFHQSPKKVWDDSGIPADYGPMAFNGKKQVGHPSNPNEMAEQLGALDATFVPLSDVPVIDSSEAGPGYNGWRFTNWKTNRHFNYVNEENRDLITDEMSAEWFKDKISELEENSNQKPFFIATGFIRPHTPLVVPTKYYEKYPIENIEIPKRLKNDLLDTEYVTGNKETRGHKAWRLLSEGYGSEELGLKKFTQAYLASINFADDMVGRVVDAIENSVFAKNTIIILFSDHGFFVGQKDHLWKYNLWKEASHVPLLIRHPGNSKNAGNVVNHPVSLIDIFPTIMDYCSFKGSTIKNDKGKAYNGYSLKPFVENTTLKKWKGPDEALTMIASWKSKDPDKQHFAIQTLRYRYIKYFNGGEELYDHQNDPDEWYNLANEKKFDKVIKDMRLRLEERIEDYNE